eukprot:74627-Chlamydomonas_euryale.AAC.15
MAASTKCGRFVCPRFLTKDWLTHLVTWSVRKGWEVSSGHPCRLEKVVNVARAFPHAPSFGDAVGGSVV